MNNDLRAAFGGYASNGRLNLDDAFCGPGSTLWYTLPLRTHLPNLLIKHNINSMLDAPCGDGHWMNLVKFPDGFDYMGADLHDDMMARNRSLYGKNYITLDITDDKLPTKDLMFVRDCLFHLTQKTKLLFFRNFISSDIKYLLTSNHPRASNVDLPHENSFLPVNWEADPWNFNAPIDVIIDYDETDERFAEFPYRTMCLWSREQIESFIKNL